MVKPILLILNNAKYMVEAFYSVLWLNSAMPHSYITFIFLGTRSCSPNGSLCVPAEYRSKHRAS